MAGGPLVKSSLEPMTMDEALEFFHGKVVLTAKEWLQLQKEARKKAFTVSNVATLDIVQDIYDELARAIETGATAKEFRERINDYIDEQGYIGLTPYRTDNIFRTNIQTAYNAGRYKQQMRPEITKHRPIWIYSAVNDSRTRPAHKALDGVARRYDDPFWDTFYPPNGYRCRCSVRTASEREAVRDNIQVEPEDSTVEVQPDQGFDVNPGKTEYVPVLTKYAPELRKEYERKQNSF